MPDLKDFLAVFVLFWPAVATVSFLAFLCIAGIIFFIGGALLIFSVFLYGAYALLRDSGSLDWFFQKAFITKKYITENVKTNVQKSFLFQTEGKIPEGPTLYIGHPHGLYALSWFIHFSLGLTDWPSTVARPVLAVHSIFFKIPLVKELFERHRCIEASEEAICKTLKEGISVVLLVGGIEELYHTNSDSVKLVLKKRKGYARIAKKMGVPLVPLVTTGENELFPASNGWIWGSIQRFLYKQFHIAVPLPDWKSLWSWGTLIYAPFKSPLETRILEAISDTSRKSQKEIRDEYVKSIEEFSKRAENKIDIIA